MGLEVFVWILGAKKWLILDPICLGEQTALHDIVFHVHVLDANLWSVYSLNEHHTLCMICSFIETTSFYRIKNYLTLCKKKIQAVHSSKGEIIVHSILDNNL